MKNYYEILEVNEKASKEVIEKAHKVLVKKYHPDLSKGQSKKDAEEKIKLINEAYDVLSNEFLKEQYDSELEKQKREEIYKKYSKNINIENKTDESRKKKSPINNINTNTKTSSEDKKANEESFEERIKKHKVGSFGGIVELCKELYKNKPKRDEIKEITKKDIIALILTVVVVILIGVALWYIPFTNGWMRELLFENPVLNAIAGIFA